MDNSLLLGQEFEVDVFLHKLATSASLTDIRDDVNEYHSKLKQELVKLINDDYHDFISITTSIDPKLIIALTHPLPILKQQIEQVRSDLALVQSNFLSKLAQRANLRDQKVCS
jgi:conserved oligomeric Golgi complex subunit 2